MSFDIVSSSHLHNDMTLISPQRLISNRHKPISQLHNSLINNDIILVLRRCSLPKQQSNSTPMINTKLRLQPILWLRLPSQLKHKRMNSNNNTLNIVHLNPNPP
ncbi:uncharacterized protein N7529_010926 [Penicillium soppii]|uniref:uncharacterized protein n=1 Tax=Penicillium soppii TaxID=69789 RepID=UPI00254900F2|nr:uncharacterized protein N7529_010926 [Penicillium soppii]KAJ5851541.1 hypothetical protein N7529_010926 [Penicillium soppii]